MLYLDLHEALESLFPPNHPTLVTLAAPPSPTSSPLLSTVNLLMEILTTLRERCAPIRDEQIDALLSTLVFPPAVVQRPITTLSEGRLPEPQISPLAQFVIDNIRAILSLAADMKSDLNNFILGSMTEEQLMDVLSDEVKSREREFVLNIWGKDEMHVLWLSWSKELPRQDKATEYTNYRWVDRLFKALEADKPVFCGAPNTTTQSVANNVHPHLFFVIPALVHIQNYLQAVIITAALQILARPPHSTPKSSTVSSSSGTPANDNDLRRDFVQHIWNLLKIEIDADTVDSPSFDGRPIGPAKFPETKVINLADEVVHARRASSAGLLDPAEEKRLRDTVDRTLRTSDPVFLVLRKRLFDALEDKLLYSIGSSQQDLLRSTIPERMQTGRSLPTGSQKKVVGIITSRKSSRLKEILGGAKTGVRFEVLGFEHIVLRNAVADAYEKLARCMIWTEYVWGNDLTV